MKRFTLLILSLLLIQVVFSQTVTVTYNVTREASPSFLPAEGATVTIYNATYCNPAKVGTVDATGKVSFDLPIPPTSTNYDLDETITLSGYNDVIRNSTTGGRTRIYDWSTSPTNTYKYLLLPNTNLVVNVAKDVAATGTPISGVTVHFACANPAINQDIVTDASGNASLPVTRNTTTNYTITITIPTVPAGYNTLTSITQSINYNASSSLTTKNIALMWLYTLNFAVTDVLSAPIAGASITCTGTPTSTAQTTDAGGLASFTKQRGTVNYTVTATGYADSTASITTAEFVTDPINISAIKLKSAYNVNFTITDGSAAPISGASIVLKRGTVSTTLSTNASGIASFPKKINGTYSYLITKSGFIDKVGILTIADADNNQPLTLAAGADFTFTVKKGGVTAISNDTLTVNGITKVTNGSGVVVFGLPVGPNNYVNKRYAYVEAAGTINVDGVTPANNVLTLALTPIYSIKFVTKDEFNVAVADATILFNGKVYKTDALGTAYAYNVAPITDPDPNKQYYKFKIFKDGYADIIDSLKCTMSSTAPYSVSTTNVIGINSNYFSFTKPRIDINYSPSMNYASLFVNGVDKTSSISYMGGGSIYNVTPGIYTYYMKYLGSGSYSPARGKVEVTSHSSARIIVSFATGYKMIVNVTDKDGNPVEGAKVYAADTIVNTDVNGAADFKERYNGAYPYTVVQKDLGGNVIGRGKGSVLIAGADVTTEVCVIQPVYSVAINVYKGWGDPLESATVTIDGVSVLTNATGVALLPCMTGTTSYTVTPPTNEYLPYSGQFECVDATSTVDVYMKKACSMSFTVTDGTNPIAGALINVGDEMRVTNASGQAEFTKTFQGGWSQYTYTVSAEGYADSTVTVWLNEDLVVEPIALKKAYDVVFTVKNSINIPLSDATIIFNNSIFKTNSIGQCTFYKKINGTYSYIVSATGFADVAGTVTVSDATVNQTITLAIGYDILFTVINGPTSSVGLYNDPITVNGATKYTDANGQVTFGVLPNANISFTHQRNGFADVPVEILNITTNTSHTINLTPVYTVKIRVIDANSYNPIQNATVVFNSETKTTDVDGYATYTAIAPSATDYAYTVTGPGTYNSASGTVSLPFTSTEEYLSTENVVTINKELSSPGVYFALTDGWMSYYGAATITFNGVDYAYETGMGGNLINCPAGTYNWVITPADETKAILKGSVTVGANEIVPVYSDVVDARKIEIFTIDKNSNPIEGATVTLADITLSTDASGDAIYNRMPAGAYNYTATKAGYIDASGSIDVNTADVIKLVTLQTVEYSITFNVTDGTSAIDGAAITIGSTTINTDALGVAVFEALIPAAYDYTIVKAGYDNATGSITLTNSNETKNVTMVLTPYTLTFNVTTGGNALEGASVTVGGTTVITDATGHAVFTGKTMGTYAYTVTKSGYNDITGSAVIEASNKTEDVSMILTPYTLTFNVTTGGNALEGASVTVGGITLTTDAAGHAVFTGKTMGTYAYTVTKSGYNDVAGNAVVGAGDITENVTMMLTSYSITFTVTNGTSAIAGASVTINSTSVTTDASGHAVFSNMLPDTYSYSVSATSYNATTGSVTVTNADVNQTVTLISTGINDVNEISVNAYPNPTNGIVYLTLPQNLTDNLTITITNVIGSVLKVEKVNNSMGKVKVDLSNYNNGIYFIKVHRLGSNRTIRVIKH